MRQDCAVMRCWCTFPAIGKHEHLGVTSAHTNSEVLRLNAAIFSFTPCFAGEHWNSNASTGTTVEGKAKICAGVPEAATLNPKQAD